QRPAVRAFPHVGGTVAVTEQLFCLAPGETECFRSEVDEPVAGQEPGQFGAADWSPAGDEHEAVHVFQEWSEYFMFGDCFEILNYKKRRLAPQLVEEDAGGDAVGQSEFPGDQSGGFTSAEDGPDDAPALLFKHVRP